MPYRYEDLDGSRFQQLCQALLVRENAGLRCFPIGHRDGGRDAVTADKLHVFQVKWTADPRRLDNPVQTLMSTVLGEEANINHLASRGMQRYTLITNVSGTGVRDSGTRDRLEAAFDKLSARFGVTFGCWWREDVDARFAAAPWELQFTYSDALVGPAAMLALLQRLHAGQLSGDHDRIIRDVVATQWNDDQRIRFREADLDHGDLADLFVDVPTVKRLTPDTSTSGQVSLRLHPFDSDRGEGAVRFFSSGRAPSRVVMLGAPGQGKSTFVQVLCQVHRAALLSESAFLEAIDRELIPLTEHQQIPLRIDVRDFGVFLAGREPFDTQAPPRKLPSGTTRTLESFLAYLMTEKGSGRPVAVSDVQVIIERYPTLLALDGLDEVADPNLRRKVIDQIERALTRMEASQGYTPSIIVTSRPSHAPDLADPNPDRFTYFQLLPLPQNLRMTYLSLWARMRQLNGSDTNQLQQVFARRSVESHVDELAQNPMQLSILLLLIRERLESLPRKRTDLYTGYMTRFLDREAKDLTVRQYREPLEEVVSYLAWYLHDQAERGGNGRLPMDELKRLMRHYLVDNDLDHTLVDTLFKAATTRVWVLTSRVTGLFEFEVQPVREFFTAKFLAEYHPSGRRAGGDKATRFGEIAVKPYWLNTTRFLAGFFTRNELADLSDDVIMLIEAQPRSFFLRRLARLLIQDEVFTERPQALNRLVDAAFDALGQRMLLHDLVDNHSSHVPRPAASRLSSNLRDRLEADPARPNAVETAGLLRMLSDPYERASWWLSQFKTTTHAKSSWFNLAPPLAAGEGLTPAQVDELLTQNPDQSAALLAAGADAAPQSEGEMLLLAAALAGQVTGWEAQGRGLPSLVAQAFDPDRFVVRIPPSRKAATDASVEHRSDLGSARRRSANRLRQTRPEWRPAVETLRLQAGQLGTTALWQDAARELTRSGHSSWLPREITIMAAGSTELRTGGTNQRGGQPFGERADPAALVEAVRRNCANEDWWSTTLRNLDTQLDQATWALSHLLCADQLLLADLAETVNQLEPSLRAALHRASLRVGASGRARGLRSEPAFEIVRDDPEIAALLAHHLSSKDRVELLRQMESGDRLRLASEPFLGVPLLATAAATNGTQDVITLELLRSAGPLAQLPRTANSHDLQAILADPDLFPWPVVALAESVAGLRKPIK